MNPTGSTTSKIKSNIPRVFQSNQGLKAGIAYSCLLLAVISVILYYTNRQKDISVSSKYFVYLLCILIPIVIGITTLLSGTISNLSNLIYPILAIIAAILFVYYVLSELSDQVWGIINFIMLVIFLFLFLAIVYKLTLRYLNTFTGWWGFIIKFIFYIPCLITDFIGYVIQDFNDTPKIVGIIFLIQLAVIGVYFIVPIIYRILKSANIITLVHKPIYLTRESIVCDNDMLKIYEPFFWFRKKPQPKYLYPTGNNGDLYLKNYSISMWIFINQNAGNVSGEIPIFKYGNHLNVNMYGKPAITYNPNGKDKAKMYTVYFSDSNTNDYSSYDFAFVPQKWNHVVITYNRNVVDFFLNGDLETSYLFKKTQENPQNSNLPSYSLQDNITVGYGSSETGERGINGAICNVEYHKIPMTKTEVQTNYKIFKNLNPPVNW